MPAQKITLAERNLRNQKERENNYPNLRHDLNHNLKMLLLRNENKTNLGEILEDLQRLALRLRNEYERNQPQ